MGKLLSLLFSLFYSVSWMLDPLDGLLCLKSSLITFGNFLSVLGSWISIPNLFFECFSSAIIFLIAKMPFCSISVASFS